MKLHKSGRRLPVAGVCAWLLVLAGCSQEGTGMPGQVLVKVNGVDITQAQLEATKAVGSRPGDNLPDRKVVLERLVNRELTVQAAVAEKLDRSPEVMMELEEARLNILARAYAKRQVVSPALLSDPQAAARFYAEHPELFSERKLYQLKIFNLPASMHSYQSVRQRMAAGDTVKDLLNWLGREKVEFDGQLSLLSAEQVPTAIVQRLSQLKPGEGLFLDHPNGVVAYELVSSVKAPRSWSSAKDDILFRLARDQSDQALVAKVAALRSQANLEYQGEFAGPSR